MDCILFALVQVAFDRICNLLGTEPRDFSYKTTETMQSSCV